MGLLDHGRLAPVPLRCRKRERRTRWVLWIAY
ncbi:MAG: hypothetical protein AB3N23_00805 [Paracoccaceae bacterium]